jgi:hypothetical protein
VKLLDVLEAVAWGEENFGGLTTNRVVPRRDVMRCLRSGLVESNGFGPRCDGDGGITHSRRDVEVFVLTEAGRETLAEHRPDAVRGRDPCPPSS